MRLDILAMNKPCLPLILAGALGQRVAGARLRGAGRAVALTAAAVLTLIFLVPETLVREPAKSVAEVPAGG